MVLRLACARLHPPPRPPRKPDARCPPRLLTTRRGASDSDRAIPGRGIKQSTTDVRVNQLSTSSVPSCLRALRVDRQDAFLLRSQRIAPLPLGDVPRRARSDIPRRGRRESFARRACSDARTTIPARAQSGVTRTVTGKTDRGLFMGPSFASTTRDVRGMKKRHYINMQAQDLSTVNPPGIRASSRSRSGCAAACPPHRYRS